MNLVIKILIAFILDLIFGDPKNILHPVQIIGKLIIFLENKFYKLGKKSGYHFWARTRLSCRINYCLCSKYY